MLLLMQQAAYQLYVYLRAGSCTIELWLKVNCRNFTCYFIIHFGPDHVQVFWKHKCFGKISQLETRPMIS